MSKGMFAETKPEEVFFASQTVRTK